MALNENKINDQELYWMKYKNTLCCKKKYDQELVTCTLKVSIDDAAKQALLKNKSLRPLF